VILAAGLSRKVSSLAVKLIQEAGRCRQPPRAGRDVCQGRKVASLEQPRAFLAKTEDIRGVYLCADMNFKNLDAHVMRWAAAMNPVMGGKM